MFHTQIIFLDLSLYKLFYFKINLMKFISILGVALLFSDVHGLLHEDFFYDVGKFFGDVKDTVVTAIP